MQDAISCTGCGLMLPCKTMKKIKDSSCAPQHYCKPCAKVKWMTHLRCLHFLGLIIYLLLNLIFSTDGSVLSVTEIKTILWHLQKDLAPFRWRWLGEIVKFSIRCLLHFNLFLFQYRIKILRYCGTELSQVCCDGCNACVHAECDKISSKFFKVLHNG